MRIKIVENKYINAIFLLMLFSATVHMLILIALAVVSGDLHILNYFNILSLSSVMPNILNGFYGDIISFIVVAFLYIFILKANEA